MISSVRNFVVRILDTDRFTIALFQILDIKSNYLPAIVQIAKKITYAKTSYDLVMCWRLLIEEFGPEFKYIQGNTT
jgi:hypothetical protein